ncbi:MAG: SEL1-like repeat protein [Alphaproteobacteria bacterium]
MGIRKYFAGLVLTVMVGLSGSAAATEFDAAMTAYNTGDYSSALSDFRILAKQGHAGAQYWIGVMYNKGRGVEVDIPEAIRWYRMAAAQDYVDAIYNLSWIYGKGAGVPIDMAKVVKWTRKAADLGDAESLYSMGVFHVQGNGVPVDLKKAEYYFRKATDQNYAYAVDGLGGLYDKNPRIFDEETVAWFRNRAESGNVGVQYLLAYLILEDKRFGAGPAESVEWFRRAALQGHAGAQGMLGIFYFQGRGIEKNIGEAVKWLTAAADAGDKHSPTYLAFVNAYGLNGPIDLEKVFRLLSLSAKRGSRLAHMPLARMYYHGDGVNKDLVQAYKWFLIAERGQLNTLPRKMTFKDMTFPGDPIPDMSKHLTSEQIAKAERLAGSWRPSPTE